MVTGDGLRRDSLFDRTLSGLITPRVEGDTLDAIPVGSVTPAAGAFTTLDAPALILNMTIPSGTTVEVATGKHLQYLTADDSVLTVDGILQVDGTCLFMDIG